ncbi:putative cyclic-di-GMP phosphodiesterase AdrB [Planctomycetes bacterium CA13]|uniref:Putative cyclic-di-GMP phosphodiesterase AdrB n=1 Tax=Novipirellula herctigrandis TaxID=2527986 RepID=A0A5C5ZBF8_9BACT|nr:putative cyclic-di-GMP phosphodiesterase AdrB [Planctomycetes bacterium CA13]
MATIDNLTLERLRRSTALVDDVWFLSGPTQPGETIIHLPIDDEPYVIGRKPGVSLRLQFRTVSGQHAALSIKEGVLYLTDLGSTNGTYINGKRVEPNNPVKICEDELIHFAEAPFRVYRQSSTGATNGTFAENICDQALALVQFDRLMSERLVRPHFQTIVDLTKETREIIGHEILGRGSVFGLESVSAMFHAAEQLSLEVELSRLLRWEGIRVGRDFPEGPQLFVNTHPKEMDDCDGLIESLAQTREMAGNANIVLEIHESTVTDRAAMKDLVSALEEQDIKLAYDDFGSGQARLAELIEARPHIVKFDISLIRGIDKADSCRRKMLSNLVNMVCDLDILALAEGVETDDESKACIDLGFQLGQGFFYGRPAPG